MKKHLSFILALLLTLTASPAIAANGDIAGKIYATDIRTCINGVWVDSYNIGGKTVVIAEDITKQYQYWDSVRTLEIYDFNLERLVGGETVNTQRTGTVTGNIYESDIKTFFRGKELTAYSLDGKMAIVVEELGDDNTFSDIGGRYVWNPSKRTLELESMHAYPYSMRETMEDMGYNMVLTYSGNVLEAEPTEAPLTGGYILCEKEIPPNSYLPITYNGEIIGYKCSFAKHILKEENGAYAIKTVQTPIEYFYTAKTEEMFFAGGKVTPTVEDWLNYFKYNTLSTIKDSYETDEYMFLYMFSSAFMSGSDRLIKIDKATGQKLEYQQLDSLVSPTQFDSVEIDRENEKVYVKYDKNYVIDLKKDTVTEYDKLETDIGVGMADGALSEYNQECARNGQLEYKLLSDGKEKIVNGFCAAEYYYANMLPLAEVFDFLGIKYSFKNDVLTIDTSEAKPFEYEAAKCKTDILKDNSINYLYVDKVWLNGEESEITYSYIGGHFDNTHTSKAKAKPYAVGGKVYINADFVSDLLNK